MKGWTMNQINLSAFSKLSKVFFLAVVIYQCNDSSFKGGDAKKPATPTADATPTTPVVPETPASGSCTTPTPLSEAQKNIAYQAAFPNNTVKGCIEGGFFFNGDKGNCTTLAIQEKTCDLDAMKNMLTSVGIETPDEPLPAKAPDHSRFFGCSHVTGAKYELVLLQYFYPTITVNKETCKEELVLHINTDCRAKKLADGVNEKITYQECLDKAGN